jgi:hypothetical protein
VGFREDWSYIVIHVCDLYILLGIVCLQFDLGPKLKATVLKIKIFLKPILIWIPLHSQGLHQTIQIAEKAKYRLEKKINVEIRLDIQKIYSN